MIFLDNPSSIEGDVLPIPKLPHIYDSQTPGEKVPRGFNAVSIRLDGRIASDLKWTEEIKTARHYIEQGKKLFWEIDLGLFSSLRFPLSDQTQFLALSFALRHFRDTIWSEFHPESVGVSIYRGPIDFKETLSWNSEMVGLLQEWMKNNSPTISGTKDQLEISKDGRWLLSLFYRDIAVQYIAHLALQLPGNLWPSLLFDTINVEEPLLLAQLLSRDRYERLHRAIKYDSPISFWTFTLHPGGILADHSIRLKHPDIVLGICLPDTKEFDSSLNKKLNEVMNSLILRHIPFRIVSEAMLTTEWDGLDDLIVMTDYLSPQGKRKLHGFCAAGGRVISLGGTLGLPNEIEFRERTIF